MADLLINATDVANANRGNVSKLDTDAAFRAACIESAQATLRRVLGYPPVANEQTQDAEIGGSRVGTSTRLRLLTVGYPTLALTTGLSIDQNRLTIAALPEDRTVRFISGWRPADLTDADLLTLLGEPNDGAGDPLEAGDLVGIPEAPPEIRQGLAEATVAIAARRQAGLIGQSESTVDLGAGSRTTRQAFSYTAFDEVEAILRAHCAPYIQYFVV